LHAATVSHVGALELAVYVDEVGSDARVVEQLVAACRSIEAVSPWRLRQIERDLERVFVVYRPGARYVPAIGACVLGLELVKRPPVEIAMAIVHEATHARLWNLGFRYGEAFRERIERICVRMEVAFARRVPGTDTLVADVLAQLENPWWTSEAMYEDGVKQLRAVGTPEWLVRLISSVARVSQAIRRLLK